MAYKTSFWSPIVTQGLKQGCLEHLARTVIAPTLFTGIYLFGNWGGERHGDDFYVVNIVPGLLRPLYYIAAGLAVIIVAAVTIPASPLTFLLDMAVTLFHDAIVKIGELTGCCELESSPNLS